jgi:hypothetical protein
MASPILDRIYNLRLANYDDSVTKIKNLTVLFEKLDATAKEMKAQLNIKANLSDTSAIDKLNTRIKELETETEKLKTQLVANTKEANLLFTNAGKIGDEFSALGEAIRAAEEPIANINQGLDEGARALAELKLRASENSTQQKTLKAAYADGRITLNEFTTSMGALIQREHELKVQVSDLTLQQREFAKENNSVSGSMEQAAIRLGRLRDEYRSLTDEEKAAPFGKNLLSTIQQLDAQIKAADGSIGNFQRNVGNYANAFSGAFSIVKKDLDDIRNKISSGTFNSEELQTFQQQEAALAGALESLNKEFTTTRAQALAFREAAAQIGLVFGQNSLIFQQFKNELGSAVDTLGDIRAQIQLASSDSQRLDQLVGAAQVVAGGFAAAQGAVALFGDENEDLQKTMVKLIAVTTVLNGLQQVANGLQRESAAGQLVIGIRTKANLAIEALRNFVLTGSIGARRAQAAVVTEETIAEAGNATAAAANTTAMAAQTAATETVTVATTAATGAMVALRFALIATGIGAIVVLLSLAASGAFAHAEAVNKENDAQKRANESLKEYGDTMDKIVKGLLGDLTQQTKQLNDELGISPSLIDKTKVALSNLADERLRIFNQLAGAESRSFSEALKDVASSWGIVEGRITNNLNQEKQLREALYKAEAATRIKTFEDELKSATQTEIELSNERSNLNIDANNRIISNDKQAFSARTKALRDNLTEQNQIIQNNLNKELIDAGPDENKRTIARQKANDELIKNERDFNDKLADIRKSASDKQTEITDRERQAQLDIYKLMVTQQSDVYKQIFDNANNSFSLRLGSLQNFFDAQKALIEADEKFQLSKAGLLPIERVKIEAEAQQKLVNLFQSFSQQRQALIQKDIIDSSNELEQLRKQFDASITPKLDGSAFIKAQRDLINDEVAMIHDGGAQIQKIHETNFIDQQTELEKQHNSGKITEEGYQRQLVVLHQTYSRKVLQIAIDTAQQQLKLLTPGSTAWVELQNNIAKARKELEDLHGIDVNTNLFDNLKSGLNGLGDEIANVIGLQNEWKTVFTTGFGVAEDVMNTFFDAQKSRIEEEKQLQLTRLDIEEKQRTRTAQSRNEQEAIDAEIAQRKLNVEHDAGERLKKIKKDEAKIALATELANIAASAAANVLNSVTFGAAGIAQYAILSALAFARYALNTKAIDSATFEKGGVVNDTVVSKAPQAFKGSGKILYKMIEYASGGQPDTTTTRGGRVKGRTHAQGGNPFVFKGRVFEDQINELNIIRTENAPKGGRYTISGTQEQIASSLNWIGGGPDWLPGARVIKNEYGNYITRTNVNNVTNTNNEANKLSETIQKNVTNETTEKNVKNVFQSLNTASLFTGTTRERLITDKSIFRFDYGGFLNYSNNVQAPANPSSFLLVNSNSNVDVSELKKALGQVINNQNETNARIDRQAENLNMAWMQTNKRFDKLQVYNVASETQKINDDRKRASNIGNI